jgi:hypothetical protein
VLRTVTAEPQRRFRLVDAMVVIAVEALALMMTRSYLRCFSALNALVSTEPGNVRAMGSREWLYACVPHLMVLSAALWPLRFARPVGRYRRTARLPGLAVSYATWVAIVFALVRSAFDLRTSLRNTYFSNVGALSPGYIFVLRVVAMKDFMGPAVAVTWFLLWLGRGWRAEPGWIDRLGRLLGVFWVAFGVAFWVDYIVRR